MSKKLILLVGNGLSISYHSHWKERLADWHPSRPLGWVVPNPSRPEEALLDALPSLTRAIELARVDGPHDDDFAIFRRVLAWARTPATQHEERRAREMAELEARHFLALAYSSFHQRVVELGAGDWEWSAWLTKIRESALYGVSFNYDCLLELALEASGRVLARTGGVQQGTVVFKPHGSIHYDLFGGYSDAPPGYPLRVYRAWNDGPVVLLPDHMLTAPRHEPVCVLPSEASSFANAIWNRARFHEYAHIAPQATHCVIAGIAFHEADRRELEFLLDRLSSSAQVNVVDPNPSRALLDALAARDIKPAVSALPLPLD